MAKLNGVKPVEGDSFEITAISYKGVEYEKTDEFDVYRKKSSRGTLDEVMSVRESCFLCANQGIALKNATCARVDKQ